MNTVSIPAMDNAEIPALTIGFENESPKAVIIICHGFGEHSGCYAELAGVLSAAGYVCIIPNQRGHGQPPDSAKKWFGIIPGYQCFIDDVIVLTEYVQNKLPGVPVVLYGHSMGGNIVLNTLFKISEQQASVYTCAVLESPWLGLYSPPNAFLTAILNVLDKITPNLIIEHRLRYDDLTNVAERAEGYGKDPLYHGFLSARMITGIFKACDYAKANAARLPVPAYLAYASDDVVVCNKAIKEFAAKAGTGLSLKEYASKHAIHNDENREQYFNDIIAYIDSKLPASSQTV